MNFDCLLRIIVLGRSGLGTADLEDSGGVTRENSCTYISQRRVLSDVMVEDSRILCRLFIAGP